MVDGEHKFWGMYRGKVLDNNDPLQLGRVKAEVYPMLVGLSTAQQMKRDNPSSFVNGIATSLLPWAVSAPPLFCGSGIGIGNFIVPDVDSKLWFFFEAGDINQPVYFAEAPDAISGLPTERTTNYPKRRVIKTAKGVVIIIDDETGNIEVTGDGDVILQGTNVRINP